VLAWRGHWLHAYMREPRLCRCRRGLGSPNRCRGLSESAPPHQCIAERMVSFLGRRPRVVNDAARTLAVCRIWSWIIFSSSMSKRRSSISEIVVSASRFGSFDIDLILGNPCALDLPLPFPNGPRRATHTGASGLAHRPHRGWSPRAISQPSSVGTIDRLSSASDDALLQAARFPYAHLCHAPFPRSGAALRSN
jgi:hypothetical protein